MALSKVMEEIKRVRPLVSEDLDSEESLKHRETLGARRGRKSQAVEQMKQYKREYRRDLLQSAAFIIVTGSEKDSFTELATGKFECFSASPVAFYEDLGNRVPASLYEGKESVVNLFNIVGRHLEDKMMELDLNEYNQLIFKQEYYVSLKNRNDLVQLLKTAVNAQIGSEIVGVQAVTSLVDTAIDKEHTKIVTPIILSTDDDKFAADLESSLRRLNPRGVFLVVAGKGNKTLRAVPNVISIKEPSEESVGQALKQISGATKK